MNSILLLFKNSWLSVSIALLTGLISGGCSAQLIALINNTISGKTINNSVWYFAGLMLISVIASFVSQTLLIRLSQQAVYSLRLRLSQSILSSPLRHLEELGSNRLLASLIDDIAVLSNTVFVIPFLCIDIAVILGCLVYLSWLSGIVFVVTVAFLLIAIVSVQLMLMRGNSFIRLAREEQDKLFKHFHSLSAGIKELKLHASRRQAFFTEELQVSAAASRQHNVKGLTTFSIATGWGQTLFFTLIGLLLFALPKIVTGTASVLPAYILTITYLMLPFQNILERLPALIKVNIALKKIDRMRLVLANQTEINSRLDLPATDNWNELILSKVIHTYRGEGEDDIFVLGELNLTFYAGQMVFIVGGNGSGKSTLAKIITGLYVPEVGEIKLDGRLITEENREWYRQHFSVVFSDYYLFDRLLGIDLDNLDTKAQQYLQQFHLQHKVKVRDGILSTTALSQGQKKRLALLTAYLEDRPIYLFDEWASDQDPSFRDIFYKQLLPELKEKGKTVLVITHDDRYFHLADRIIKLDYGKVEYDKLILDL